MYTHFYDQFAITCKTKGAIFGNVILPETWYIVLPQFRPLLEV